MQQSKNYKLTMKLKSSKIIVIALLLAVVCTNLLGFFDLQVFAQAQDTPYYSGSYYDGVNTALKGNSMYTELANLITSTHKNYTSYSDLASAFKTADADPNKSGNIIWFYTGTSVSFSSFGSGGGQTNREHVWPKDGGDAFPKESGPGSDAHHLRPTETGLNSSRGSLSFDEVSQTSSNIVKQNGKTSYGNSANGKDALCYKSGSFFYPAKGYRGATARILLYMYVRWGTQYNLRFVDSAGSSKTIGKISTLLKWHYEEKPDAAEIARNEAVYKIQGNRNPFIDHPEWATTILCDSNQSYSENLKTIAQTYNTYDDEVGGGTTKIESITPTVNGEMAYSLNLTVGQSQTLGVIAEPQGVSNQVTFSSNNNSVARVSEDGTVLATGEGTATITLISKVNSDVRAFVTVNVKQATGITVSGTPNKTTYTDGDLFDPTGLTIAVDYSDGSSGYLSATDCQWLDATTNATTLSQGTQTVICKYGSFTDMVTGITVGASQRKTVTIDRNSFTASGSYNWYDFSNNGVSVSAYFYAGTTDKLQFNNSKTAYCLFGSASQAITSVTVYLADNQGAQWELRTNSSPYEKKAYSNDGTSHGTKTLTSSGVTWNLTGNTDCYFILNYKDSGVGYIQKIEITYGGAGEVTPPTQSEVTLDKTSANMQTGDTLTLNATATGNVVWSSSNTSVATVNNGVVTAVGKGTATISAICGSAIAECIVTVTLKPCVTHDETEWIVDVPASCTNTGSKHTECIVCGQTIQTETINALGHQEGEWIVDKQATCSQTGSKHTECSVCRSTVQTQTIDKTPHTFGYWKTTTAPTAQADGTQRRDCAACDAYETRTIPYAGDTSAFTEAVNAIPHGETLQQRYLLIRSAVTIYNGYTTEQKQQVENDFKALINHIQSYNQQIEEQNQSMQTAINVSVATISVTLVATAVLWLLKRYF